MNDETVENNKAHKWGTAEKTKTVVLQVEEESYFSLKKILWTNGLSFQQFLFFVCKLALRGDSRISTIISEARENKKTAPSNSQVVLTKSQNIYATLEDCSPLTKRNNKEISK
jgi:hypothetical protein